MECIMMTPEETRDFQQMWRQSGFPVSSLSSREYHLYKMIQGYHVDLLRLHSSYKGLCEENRTLQLEKKDGAKHCHDLVELVELGNKDLHKKISKAKEDLDNQRDICRSHVRQIHEFQITMKPPATVSKQSQTDCVTPHRASTECQTDLPAIKSTGVQVSRPECQTSVVEDTSLPSTLQLNPLAPTYQPPPASSGPREEQYNVIDGIMDRGMSLLNLQTQLVTSTSHHM